MTILALVLTALLALGFILLILKKDRLLFDIMLFIVGLFSLLSGLYGGLS